MASEAVTSLTAFTALLAMAPSCIAQDGSAQTTISAYATGFATLDLAGADKHLTAGNRAQLEKPIAWINREPANPYPAGPR